MGLSLNKELFNKFILKRRTVYIYQNFGNEELGLEFKKACPRGQVKLRSWFSNKTLEEICTYGIIKEPTKLNKFFLALVDEMIKHYLPKYPCALSTVKPTKQTSSARLYFGIDDDGIATGIPFYGTLDKKRIVDICKSQLTTKNIRVFNDDKKHLNDMLVQEFINNITINIIELDFEQDKIADGSYCKTHQIENIVYKRRKKMRRKKHSYYEKKKKHEAWKKIHAFWTRATYKTANNPSLRSHLVEYIIHNDGDDLLELIGFLLHTNKDGSCNQVYVPKDHDEFQIHKNNRNDPLHWVCKYKDTMTKMVDLRRPKKPSKPSESYLEPILYNSSSINPYLIMNGFKFFIIEMIVKPMDDGTVFEWYNDVKDEFVFTWRDYDYYGDPCCRFF